jgi:PAS domain-containing protein
LGGGSRLLAFAALLRSERPDTPWVVVAVPTDAALRPVRAALVRNVGLLLLASAVIVAIAWVASDRLVLRRIRALVVAARRFGSGDLRARAGPAGGAVELAELASAFDDMADGIGRISEQNRSILDAVGDDIYGLDRRGRVTLVNPAAARMSGYAVEELLGVSMHARLHHSRPDGSPYRRRFPALGKRLVFVTGDLLDPAKQRFLASTGATIVAKPFDITEVRLLVRRLLFAARA